MDRSRHFEQSSVSSAENLSYTLSSLDPRLFGRRWQPLPITMGFLSFLSKRSGDKSKSKPQAPEPAPKTTLPPKSKHAVTRDFSGVAVNLHVQIEPFLLATSGTNGTNGTIPDEMVTRGRSRFTQTQLELDTVPITDAVAPAPSPAVPLFHEDATERPSTAPNGSPPNTIWAGAGSRLRKNPLRGAPPVSFRMLRPSTANPGGRPVSDNESGESTAGPLLAAPVHSRSNSMLSDSGKGFKDLLDAQSEIKPADFRSRVKASGARDYGEDVADRNLGENGFDLESSPVQAFYHATQTPKRSHEYGPLAQQYSASSLYIPSIRANSLTSSSSYTMPKKAASHTALVPQLRPSDIASLSDSQSPLLRRRQSVNTWMPPNSLRAESDPSPKRSSGLRTTSNPSRFLTTPEAEKLSRDLPTLPSLGLKSPIGFGSPKAARPATAHSSPRLPRDSIILSKQRAGAPIADHLLDDGIPVNPLSSQRAFPLRMIPRSSRGSVISPATTAIPRKRHSLHTLQSSSFANRDTVFDATPLSYPRHKHHPTIKLQVSDDTSMVSLPDATTIDFDVAASPTKLIDPSRSSC